MEPGIAIDSINDLYGACRRAFVEVSALLGCGIELPTDIREKLQMAADQCEAALTKALAERPKIQ